MRSRLVVEIAVQPPARPPLPAIVFNFIIEKVFPDSFRLDQREQLLEESRVHQLLLSLHSTGASFSVRSRLLRELT